MLHQTWFFLLAMVTGLLDEQARLLVDYLKEENRVLREQLHDRYGCKKPRLNNSQRRRLAVKAKPLGRKVLAQASDLFSPDTLLGWYRNLIAAKYNGQANVKGGRPKVSQEIIDLALRMSQENSSWGFMRIHNYMKYLGYSVGRSTVRRILEDHGIKPKTPKRSPNWKQFIASHMDVMAATDFFSVEVLTPKGLVRHMVLFAIDLSSRRVEILGVNHSPDGQWMKQIARNLVDSETGFLKGKRYLIHDRDALYTKAFAETLRSAGVESVKTVRQSPNMNPFAERFVQTVRHECLDHMILTSEAQLRYVLDEFVEYYHRERPHEGLGGRMIDPLPPDDHGEIVSTHRLGGLLGSYRRVKTAA
jgi:putative transposase